MRKDEYFFAGGWNLMKVLGYILMLIGAVMVYMGWTGKSFTEVFQRGQ